MYGHREQDVINIITARTMDTTGRAIDWLFGLIDSAGAVSPEGGGDGDQRPARRDAGR